MSNTAFEHQMTARVFLFGEEDRSDILARSLERHGVIGTFGEALRGLSRVGREAATIQIAAVAEGLLEHDLVDILLAGWRKYADLTAAARRTAAAHGSREVVELAAHTITSTHHPYVDVFVDGTPAGRVHFELKVTFLVQALVATVGDGRLVELGSGDCDITANLAADGRQLITRHGSLKLPAIVRLGSGVALLDPSWGVVPLQPQPESVPPRDAGSTAAENDLQP